MYISELFSKQIGIEQMNLSNVKTANTQFFDDFYRIYIDICNIKYNRDETKEKRLIEIFLCGIMEVDCSNIFKIANTHDALEIRYFIKAFELIPTILIDNILASLPQNKLFITLPTRTYVASAVEYLIGYCGVEIDFCGSIKTKAVGLEQQAADEIYTNFVYLQLFKDRESFVFEEYRNFIKGLALDGSNGLNNFNLILDRTHSIWYDICHTKKDTYTDELKFKLCSKLTTIIVEDITRAENTKNVVVILSKLIEQFQVFDDEFSSVVYLMSLCSGERKLPFKI